MKFVLLVSALLFAQMALALPHVGDEADYDVSTSGQDSTVIRRVVVSVDAAHDQCVMKDIAKGVETQSTIECSRIDSAAFTPELCKKVGGEMGMVNVPAGHFNNACMIYTTPTDFMFYGNVPFGLIYYEHEVPGQTVTMQLHNYNVAQ